MYFNVDTEQHQNGIKYCLMVVLATVFYAISVNIIRKYLYNINSITATVWSFSFIGPIALIYLFIRTNFINTLHEKEHAVSALGYIIILGVIGSALSVILFNSLIKMAGAVFASSVTYLIPVVAIVWGIFDQERIVWQQFTAMAVIFGAIYLINRK
jgi:drug/metabolite transporter (DMT)-like permease